MKWQEGRAYGEAYARVKERGYSARGNEILNEQAIVLGVLLGKGAELLVLDEDEVGWQHHELTTWVLELHRPVPLLDGPRQPEQQIVVTIVEERRGGGPWARVALSLIHI